MFIERANLNDDFSIHAQPPHLTLCNKARKTILLMSERSWRFSSLRSRFTTVRENSSDNFPVRSKVVPGLIQMLQGSPDATQLRNYAQVARQIPG